MGTETIDYYARLDEADAALVAGDKAAELLAVERALTAALKLSNINQQNGNSINWSNARDILKDRIAGIKKEQAAALGIQRTLANYIRPTS